MAYTDPQGKLNGVVSRAVRRQLNYDIKKNARFKRFKQLEQLASIVNQNRKPRLTCNLFDSVTYYDGIESIEIKDDDPENFPSEGLLLRLHILLK